MAEIDETKIRTLWAEHYRRWKQNGASRDVFDSRVVRAAQLSARVDWSVKIGVTLNRTLLWLVTVLFVASGHLAEAQQPKKIPRIGYLAGSSLSSITTRIEALREGLRERGYVEGKNIIVEYRSAEGKLDRLPALAAELVNLKVAVIVTVGPTVTRPVKEATSTIPIVMAQDTDLVGNGFVASLANLAGTSQDCQVYVRR
jgi:ABC-type uncharacterized transport system substrate-binding protein